MSQSKIEALKSSNRKSAVKQEILPQFQPIIRPTRDIAVQKHTLALNIKQGTATDIYTYQKRIQQLERELQDYQFEHQANIVYNKQFKILGKIFGNEDMEFEEIRQKIEDSILNTTMNLATQTRQSNFLGTHNQKIVSSLDDQHFAQQILGLSRQELKERLMHANRSEFLSILELGSTFVFENESAEQRRRKGVREMFYQIWRQVVAKTQQDGLKLQTSQAKRQSSNYSSFEIKRYQQKIIELEKQVLDKNKHITQLAQELEKANTLMVDGLHKSNAQKDSYNLIEKQCEFLTHQNEDLKQQVRNLKQQIINIEDKLRQYEDKQFRESLKKNENDREVQMLREELRQAKFAKEKQCRDLIAKIDELMAITNKYDQTIADLQAEKNEMIREVWIYKANIEDLTNKFKAVEQKLILQEQKSLKLESHMKEEEEKYQVLKTSYDVQSQRRITELNGQIISLREEFDIKQRELNYKITKMVNQKQQIESRLTEISRQYEILRDRESNEVEPHTAVFGRAKLSQQLRTSILDNKGEEIEQKNRQIYELQRNIEDLKTNTVHLQIAIAALKEQNKMLHKQIEEEKQIYLRKHNDIEQQLISSNEVIKKKDIYISEMTNTLGTHIQTLDDMGKQMTKIQESYDALIQQNNNMRSEYETTFSNYRKSRTEIETLNVLVNKLNQSLESLKQLNQTLRTQNNQLKLTIQNQREQITQLIQHRTDLSTSLPHDQKLVTKIYNNSAELHNELRTIQEIMDSHNSINDNRENVEQREASISLSRVRTESQETNNAQENVNLRNNQAFNQSQNTQSNADQGYNFKLRPAIQKNSAKFQAMMKQSQQESQQPDTIYHNTANQQQVINSAMAQDRKIQEQNQYDERSQYKSENTLAIVEQQMGELQNQVINEHLMHNRSSQQIISQQNLSQSIKENSSNQNIEQVSPIQQLSSQQKLSQVQQLSSRNINWSRSNQQNVQIQQSLPIQQNGQHFQQDKLSNSKINIQEQANDQSQKSASSEKSQSLIHSRQAGPTSPRTSINNRNQVVEHYNHNIEQQITHNITSSYTSHSEKIIYQNQSSHRIYSDKYVGTVIENSSYYNNSQGRVQYSRYSAGQIYNQQGIQRVPESGVRVIPKQPNSPTDIPTYSAASQTRHPSLRPSINDMPSIPEQRQNSSKHYSQEDQSSVNQNAQYYKEANKQSVMDQNREGSQKTLNFVSQTVIKETQQSDKNIPQPKQEVYGKQSVYNAQNISQNNQKVIIANNQSEGIKEINNQQGKQIINSMHSMSDMSKIISTSKPVIYATNSNKSLSISNNGASQDLQDKISEKKEEQRKQIGLEKESKSAISQSSANGPPQINYHLAQSEASSSQAVSPPKINTESEISTPQKPQNYGPNVVEAESHQTLVQNQGTSPNMYSIYSGSAKQVSLRLEEQQKRSSINSVGLARYISQPNLPIHPSLSGYPSPSKVVVAQKIENLGNKRVSNDPKQVINSYIVSGPKFITNEPVRIQQIQSVPNTNQILNNIASQNRINSGTKIIYTNNSQQKINIAQRSLSPSSSNPNIASTLSRKEVVVRQISPNVSSQSINSKKSLSPQPHDQPAISSGTGSESLMSRRLFETFNPSSYKNISIYTSKPIIQRPESHQSPYQRSLSPHERSLSPPASSKKLVEVIQSNNNISSMKQSIMNPNIMQSQVSLQQTVPRDDYSNKSHSNINPNFNNTAIMMLETKPDTRSKSLQAKIPLNSIFYGQNIESSRQNYGESVSNHRISTVKTIQQQRRPISNHTITSNDITNPPRSISSMRAVSPLPSTSPLVAYGIDNVGANVAKSMKFNQVNSKPNSSKFPRNPQIPNYKYTSKPITQTVWTPSALNYQTTPQNEYFDFNQQQKSNSKQQMWQEIFSSKHKLVDGLEDSNSSGIQVQQKGSFMDCCPNC